MNKRFTAALIGCFLMSACASMQPAGDDSSRDPAASKAKGAQAAADLDSPSEIEKILEETNPVLSEAGGESEKVPLHIPIEINRKVSEWINFFTVRERERTLRYLERGEALRPHLEQMLKEYLKKKYNKPMTVNLGLWQRIL